MAKNQKTVFISEGLENKKKRLQIILFKIVVDCVYGDSVEIGIFLKIRV